LIYQAIENNLLHNWRYQVGITPEKVEIPRLMVDEEMQEKVKALPKESQPATLVGSDLKWRYMWSVGPRPANTRFKVSHLHFLLQFHIT